MHYYMEDKTLERIFLVIEYESIYGRLSEVSRYLSAQLQRGGRGPGPASPVPLHFDTPEVQ